MKVKLLKMLTALVAALCFLCGWTTQAQQAPLSPYQFAELHFQAGSGDAGAQFRVGICFYNGEGVTKDWVEAVKWYRKAAEQGNAMAQFCLGVCYYDRGESVTNDWVEAYKWWLLAGAQGNEDAKKNLAILERTITATQRAEGQKLARDFSARTPIFVPPSPDTLEPLDAATRTQNSQPSAMQLTDDELVLVATWLMALLCICLLDVHLLATSGLLTTTAAKVSRFSLGFIVAAPISAIVLLAFCYVPSWHGLFLQGGLVARFYLSVLVVGLCLGVLATLFWRRISPQIPLLWWIRLHQQHTIIFVACIVLAFTVAHAPWQVKMRQDNQVLAEKIVFNSIFSVPVVPGFSNATAEIKYPVLFIEWFGILAIAGAVLFITKPKVPRGSHQRKP